MDEIYKKCQQCGKVEYNWKTFKHNDAWLCSECYFKVTSNNTDAKQIKTGGK